MSESNVKVTITGDTSAAEDALKRVTISAADFAKSLQAAAIGNTDVDRQEILETRDGAG